MRVLQALCAAALSGTFSMMGCGLLSDVQSPGGSGPGPNTSVGGLRIDASLGVDIRELPGTGESAVSAIAIAVQKQDASGKKDVSMDSVLQINGVTIPYSADTKSYVFSNVTIPNAGPGSTITLSATRGTDSATFQVQCPDAALSMPAENTKVTEGQTVPVSWTGRIRYASGVLFGPLLRLKGYSPTTQGVDPIGEKGTLVSDTSGTVKIPAADGRTGYVIELNVPGDAVSGDGGNGLCIVNRRRHVLK